MTHSELKGTKHTTAAGNKKKTTYNIKKWFPTENNDDALLVLEKVHVGRR